MAGKPKLLDPEGKPTTIHLYEGNVDRLDRAREALYPDDVHVPYHMLLDKLLREHPDVPNEEDVSLTGDTFTPGE